VVGMQGEDGVERACTSTGFGLYSSQGVPNIMCMKLAV
jgi:hypothetical protein